MPEALSKMSKGLAFVFLIQRLCLGVHPLTLITTPKGLRKWTFLADAWIQYKKLWQME